MTVNKAFSTSWSWGALVISGLLLGASGCASSNQSSLGVPQSELAGEDIPRSLPTARRLEANGLRELSDAQRNYYLRRKRNHYDSALAYFREARDLYVNEQLMDPGTPERTRYLELEIARLSDLIEKTHSERPLTTVDVEGY